jgi:hypothetical protein
MITLKTLPQATAQQVFDQVASHLLTQNAKSIAKNPHSDDPGNTYCVYKSPNNLACAAGCLIATDEYKEVWEEVAWDRLVKDYNVPDTHQDLISKLQMVHDSRDVEKWPGELRSIANAFGLDASIVDTFNK